MQPAKFILAGLAATAAFVAVVLYVNQDTSPHIEGEILQVRTLGMDENSSVAIVDFKGTNAGSYPLVIARRVLAATTSTGREVEGETIAKFDLEKLFEYFPALGPAENEAVLDKTRLQPEEAIQGMVAARFEIPKHELDTRRQITLRIVDAGDSVSEITQRNEAVAHEGEAQQ